MMCIDGADRIISCDLVGEGTVNMAGVIPRHMLETALRGKATGVIIAHNHPHGDASASDEDLNMTHMLYNLFYSSGIRLIEHYIASVDECEGIISKYKESFI
jgi:DNA repair protein RadC